MAKTSLRAYIREIETLVEQSQFEPAIDHAKHILKFYPKHLQTYRILGKAYLESQRYGDASDVFQRVLSAIPDDFVSHVGMSIIREDEGNLDFAIWHMERAFEIQPANSTIQGELRRLYGRRDGMEPPKIRLTRGALARMYVKGELYQQAIAELRAALTEDPQRPDLLALLADAYFLTGQRVEAADTCSTLLKKTPYCLEANRILSEILSSTERASEAQLCRQRVYALDPYAAHISPSAPTAERVSDSLISLEKLVWTPGQPVSSLPEQPDWAASIGVDLGEPAKNEEPVPDWLAQEVEKSSVFSAEPTLDTGLDLDIPPSSPDSEVSEDQIPGWMKTAGWGPASSDEEEEEGEVGEEEVVSKPAVINAFLPEEDEIAPADIPDWLQAIAPGTMPVEETLAEQLEPDMEPEGSSEIPDWLTDLGHEQPGEPEELANEISDQFAPAEIQPVIEDEEEPPHSEEWLEEEVGEEDEVSKSAVVSAFLPEEDEIASADIPDWLQAIAPGTMPVEEALAEQVEPDTEPEGSSEIPDWLADMEHGEPSKPEFLTDEITDHFAPAEIQPVIEDEEEPPYSDEWLEDKSQAQDDVVLPAEPAQVLFEPSESSKEDDEAFAWLESLAAKQGADEALLLSPEERREEPPEWVQEESGKQTSQLDAPTPQGVDDEPVDWLHEETSEDMPIDSREELPEWVSEFEGLTDLESEEEAEIPEDEQLFTADQRQEPFTEMEKMEELPEAEPGELPEWLREVSGAHLQSSEPALSSAPEESDEFPFETITGEPFPEPELEAEEEDGLLPDWLKGTVDLEPEIEDFGEPISDDDLVALTAEKSPWSSSQEEEPELEMLFGPQVTATEETPSLDQPSIEAVADDELVTDLFEEEESEPIEDTQPTRIQLSQAELEPEAPSEEPSEEPQTPIPSIPDMPEWAQDLGEGEVVSDEIGEVLTQEADEKSIDDDAAFAWLEGLATRMGAEEALLLEPEARTEEPPEWIQEAAEKVEELPPSADELDEELTALESVPEQISEDTLILDEIDVDLPAEEVSPIEIEAEEITIPLSEGLQDELEELPDMLGSAEIDVMPESIAIEAGESIEDIQDELGEGTAPDLPSWLSDAEEVEHIPEGQDWTPPEEARSEGLMEPWSEEDIVSKEPFELAGEEVSRLDINQAGLAELEQLPGVGFTRAQAILAYRQAFGPFGQLDEIINVSGFDQTLLDGLMDLLIIGEIQPEDTPTTSVDVHQLTLIQARNALISGDSSKSIQHYVSLIQARQLLPQVIQDLNEALYRFPVDISIWEALGDAHVRLGHLQDALDAYTKAEELIR